jgi:hypothetical protein
MARSAIRWKARPGTHDENRRPSSLDVAMGAELSSSSRLLDGGQRVAVADG